ncbi:copper-binding protein [bacterium (Candidatus Howlettbacteria) CG_4_10_14_0_8_um_filter_40_9]|nr:MAG: copper-binding protein [bacterium (Candidatus Howlettbacteria) CG_4_10_14_0_8_um_filter_40_9]
MDKIIVGIGGVGLSIFVIWYFLLKSSRTISAVKGENIQEIYIIVDGGYKPDSIELKKGVPAKLMFDRKDPSDCLSEVVIGDFKIRQKLELGKVTTVEFTPGKKGEFDFSCGMGMFHGKIIVK